MHASEHISLWDPSPLPVCLQDKQPKGTIQMSDVVSVELFETAEKILSPLGVQVSA